MPIPTPCRIVAYTLTASDAARIMARRKGGWKHAIENGLNHLLDIHEGNQVEEGDVYPLLITKTWGPTETSAFNGTVFLDGGDTLWITSTAIGAGPGRCAWPMQQASGQANPPISSAQPQPQPEAPAADPLPGSPQQPPTEQPKEPASAETQPPTG